MNVESFIGVTIKSLVLDDSYDAVYGGGQSDEPGTSMREPLVGFVVIEKGSRTCGRGSEVWQDEVVPFVFGELGFELCESVQNFIGIVKKDQPIPQWMESWINKE